jgi:hypothetical protein
LRQPAGAWLGRYSIGAKLLVAPVLIIALLLMVAGVAWFGMSGQQDVLRSFEQVGLSNTERPWWLRRRPRTQWSAPTR